MLFAWRESGILIYARPGEQAALFAALRAERRDALRALREKKFKERSKGKGEGRPPMFRAVARELGDLRPARGRRRVRRKGRRPDVG